MKKCLIAAVCACALVGCVSGPGPQIQPAAKEHVAVLVSNRAALKQAIILAATRRRWMPSEVSESVIRCTLVQRQHKVEIDVVLEGDKAYTLRCVSCNIPEAKYQQWIGNLQREIAKEAALPAAR